MCIFKRSLLLVQMDRFSYSPIIGACVNAKAKPFVACIVFYINLLYVDTF